MLTSIESPEGAITQFEYEPNTAEVEYEKIEFLRKDTLRKATKDSIVSFDFNLQNAAYIKLNFIYNEGATGIYNHPYADSIISIYDQKGKNIKHWRPRQHPTAIIFIYHRFK